MKRINRETGFTLFEMVIAISIFALMSVFAFAGLNSMTKTGQSVADANNRLSDLQFAMAYFKRDWIQVSSRRIRNQYGDEENNLIINDNVITFTRSGWSNLLGQKRSSLQRVQYLVEDGNLIRRYWASLDQGIGEEPINSVLLEKVESIQVHLKTGSDQAIEVWPPEQSKPPGTPIVLAFILTLNDLGELTRLLEIPDAVL